MTLCTGCGHVQYAEAATVCLTAIAVAAGNEALSRALKATEPPLIPKDVVLAGKITHVAGDTVQALVRAPDGSLINTSFSLARSVSGALALLDPQEPSSLKTSALKRLALAGKILTPLLYCAEAAFVVDAQLGARIGTQIRAALP